MTQARSRILRDGGRPPLALSVPAVLALLLLTLPLAGLVLRAPWSDLLSELARTEVRQAIRLSIVASVAATALSVVLGVPLAWMLARGRIPGRSLVRALVTVPMVLPPVVGGVALLLAFGRRGIIGQWLHAAFGITIPFSTPAVVLAETFVAMPFFVVAVEAGLRSMDRRFEDAAATLGAGRWSTFRRVTLPLVLPSIAAGSAVCWARALGEFGATITFAGNLPGRTQTVPLAVFLALETRPDAAIALSLILLFVSVLVLVVLRDRWMGGTQ